MCKWRRRHIPGAEARFSGWLNAWAKAQAYLRSKDKNEAKAKTKQGKNETRQKRSKAKPICVQDNSPAILSGTG
jgi:hypothetical protein